MEHVIAFTRKIDAEIFVEQAFGICNVQSMGRGCHMGNRRTAEGYVLTAWISGKRGEWSLNVDRTRGIGATREKVSLTITPEMTTKQATAALAIV